MDSSKVSRFQFNRQVLETVVGGVSTIDTPELSVRTEEEARHFIAAYGYDITDPEHLEQLWGTHRRAVSLIEEHILDPGEHVPAELADPIKLGSLTKLLLAASDRSSDAFLQRWACAILRVMHVDVHLRNDLFSAFRDEIQSQILKPLQDAIVEDDISGSFVLGPNLPGGGVKLHKFEIKPFKTTASSVIKLLARPERVALTLLDKLGVRFVTRSLFDSFLTVKFLSEQHLMSFPHIIPDQSNNTLYPINLFLEVMEELKSQAEFGLEVSNDAIRDLLNERLEKQAARAKYLEKGNEFSGPEYRFLKFINRKLITVNIGEGENKKAFRFFYPFEVQIMDQETYNRNLAGPMAHDEYKNRQRKKARERVMGEHLL
jgi:uncharacterized protein (TIGR04562 family)